MTVHIPLPLASLATINDEDSLRGWVRYELRPVFPHQCCVLSIAMPGENGMESRLVGVDFPAAALRSIISAGGGIDTPVVRRWLQQRRPQLFDADQPWDGTCEVWLGKFRYFDMHNTAAHGDYDAASACTCYFSFLNVPDITAPELEATLLALQQPLAAALRRLLQPATEPAAEPGTLTEREQQIGYWAGQGKSNWEIAAILGISEYTTKTHVANLLRKLGLASRAGLQQHNWPYLLAACLLDILLAFCNTQPAFYTG